jgi:hypothetical protein
MIVRSTEPLCGQAGDGVLGKVRSSAVPPHNGGGHITWIMFPGT